MVTLFDDFVMWFNGLFGLEYAGYSWITAIIGGFFAVCLAYLIVKLALKPLIPLFNAEHSKIGSERPSIDKGMREALRSGDSFQKAALEPADDTEPVSIENERPLIQILPLEDFNHICPEASKLAGHLADGLAITLREIPQVSVERATLDTMPTTNHQGEPQFVISGSVKNRVDDVVVTALVRDTKVGDQIWTQSQICKIEMLADLERELAVEIASAVLQRHRQNGRGQKAVRLRTQTAGQSGSKYPSGRRPLPVRPNRTGRQAM